MKEVEIEAFLAVVEMGSISAAATSLFITQPALSRRVSALEDELGYRLFIRNKGVRNIDITPEGKAFITVAKKWKALFLESKGLVEAFDHKYDFNLGVTASMSTYLMPLAFKEFVNKHPECNMNIHQYHSEECYAHMEKGDLDLALVGKEQFSRTIATIPLCRTEFKLVCAKDSFTTKAVHPSQLDSAKELVVPWGNHFENWHDYWFGSTAKPRVWLDMMSILEYFLADKDSWVVAPAYIAAYLVKKLGLELYNLSEPPQALTMYAIYNKENESAYAKKFLDIAKSNLGNNPSLQLLL